MAIRIKRHSQLTGDDMSTLVWKHVDDNPALLALTPLDEDLGKVVQQDDTNQLWFLARTAPSVLWIDLTAQAAANPLSVYDEGGIISNDVTRINYVGNGVTASLSGGFLQVAVPGGGGAGSTFLALSDTPSSYGGNSVFIVRVNETEDALEFVELTSQLVKIAATPGAENTDLASNSALLFSTGVYTWDGVTDLGGGNIEVGAGTGLIRAGGSNLDPIFATKWDADTVVLPDQVLTWIWVNYNGGTPIVQSGPVVPGNFQENIILGTIARDGAIFHPTPSQVLTSDAFLRVSRRLFNVSGLTHAEGAALSEETTPALTFSITAAEWWLALVDVQTVAWDGSGTDRFFYFWRDGVGGWNFNTGQQFIDNQRYDDGSGVLATLTTNTRRGVHWVYRGVDDHTYVLYGRGNYTSSQAQDAAAPADVPSTFQAGHAALIGKIVVQKNQTTFDTVESAFSDKLSVGTITEHGSLGELTDDDHLQYALNTSSTSNPTINDDSDDGWRINTLWTNTTTKQIFVCLDATVGAAVWEPFLARSLDRDFNFEPLCSNLNEWYSVAAWQGMDDATFSHNTSYGTAALPAIPAGSVSGVVAPFDCVVTVIANWAIADSATQETEIGWFKFPLVDGATGGGTAVQVDTTQTLGPVTIGDLVDLEQNTFTVALNKGDILLPCAREGVVAGSTSTFSGTICLRETP